MHQFPHHTTPQGPSENGQGAAQAPVEQATEISETAATVRALESPSGLPQGFRDQFFERRFRNQAQIDVEELIARKKIAFLTKAVHTDELYQVSLPPPGYPSGQYRIRNSGSERPFLTLKRQGDGAIRASDVVDIIEPDDTLLSYIRKHGELLAVIEKFRSTYHSKDHPQCLLHVDVVPGLGNFYDVKADHPDHLQRFMNDLGLATSTPISKSYLQMLQDQGISKLFLKIWPIHEVFKDYVQGVLSGSLTSVGFLIFTVTAGGSKAQMIASLLTAGLVDGMSDSVAAGQATQSESGSTSWERFSKFTKTLAGKCIIPCTYAPIVIACHGQLSTSLAAALWAGALVATTTAIQSIAKSRPLTKETAIVLGYAAGAVALGTMIGKYALPLLERLFA